MTSGEAVGLTGCALAGTTALTVTFVLGTIGWLFAAGGIGTSCDEALECTSSCTPCAAAHASILAGGIGQWVLFAAAATILVLGLRRPDLRRTTTVAAGGTVLLCRWLVVVFPCLPPPGSPQPPSPTTYPAP